jgi:hypothetical protein
MRVPSTLFFALLIAGFFSKPALARSQEDLAARSRLKSCYLHEIDARTNRPFETRQAYDAELDRWNRVSRPAVGPIDLLVAYRAYRSGKPFAEALGTDKAMHCYIGCMISLATSAKVTDYVGWLKEYQDLTDCDPTTHFEDADSDATSRGARLGARDHSECSNLCVREFDPKHAPAIVR